MQSNFLRSVGLTLALLTLGMLSTEVAQAAQQGTIAEGRRFISGGVSDTEIADMKGQRSSFSLWVVTAAKKSGAFQADARVVIVDQQQRVVFDALLDGPWLLIDLPVGRYVVRATADGETQQQATTIHPGDHHQIVFHIGGDADVGHDAASAPGLSK